MKASAFYNFRTEKLNKSYFYINISVLLVFMIILGSCRTVQPVPRNSGFPENSENQGVSEGTVSEQIPDDGKYCF